MNYKQDAKMIIECSETSENETICILKSVLEFADLSGMTIFDVNELISNIIEELK